MWKWFLALLVISVAACGTGGFFLSRSPQLQEYLKNLNPAERVIEVRLGQVEKGTLVRTVNAPGSIEPKTKVQISAQVAARIIALPFRQGDPVKEGDVVVRLDARELAAFLESAQAQQRSAEANLEGSRAALVRAEQELNRQRELAKTGDSPRSALENAQSEFDRAKAAADSALHAIEVAKANVTRARKDLDNTEIRAPFDGVVTKLNAEVGELVLVGTLNNAASVIMEIADLGTMIMKARVDEANIAPIKPQQRSRVFVNAFPGRTFEGVVDRVGLKREVDRDGTGYYEVEILLAKVEEAARAQTTAAAPSGSSPAPEAGKPALPASGQQTLLKSGLTANVDIEVEAIYDAVLVPSQALVDRKLDDLPKPTVDGTELIDRARAFARVVYIVVEGKAKAVPVRVGASDLTRTSVLAGLDPGTTIITGPFRILQELRDDRKVQEEGKKKEGEGAAGDKTAVRGLPKRDNAEGVVVPGSGPGSRR